MIDAVLTSGMYYAFYAIADSVASALGLPLPGLKGTDLPSFAVNSVLYFLYYFIFEAVTGGITPGKYVTGTIAVMDNGEPLTTRAAMYRSLWRLLPIEPLSIIGGSLWHDAFPGTAVVRKTPNH